MNITSFRTIPTSLYFGSGDFPGFVKKKGRANCSSRDDDVPLTSASAYAVLGLNPHCSAADMKAAFRAKVPTSLFPSLIPISPLIHLSFSLSLPLKGKAVPSRPHQTLSYNTL